jgi:alpha-tubulin suppressor-like RCC1 family protein
MVGRCAQLKSGIVTCFDGTTFVVVPGVQRATQLAVGRAHACALAGGAIVCWGDNARGQLGEFAVTP